MRWLLAKDLRILRRSPLLVALLVAYPIVLALLIGFALSSPPGKPKVAILNEVAPGQGTFDLGGEKVDASKYAERAVQVDRPDPRPLAQGGDRDRQVAAARWPP